MHKKKYNETCNRPMGKSLWISVVIQSLCKDIQKTCKLKLYLNFGFISSVSSTVDAISSQNSRQRWQFCK